MQLTSNKGVGMVLTAALEKVADQVGTYFNRGKAGWYLAVRAKGSTPDESAAISGKFKALGYSEFKGAFTKLITDMAQLEQAKVELQQFSAEHGAQIDMSGIETIAGKLDPKQLGTQRPAPAATDNTVPSGDSPADAVQNMADKVRDDLAKSPRDQVGDTIGKTIADYLEKLANEVDAAKQQDFLKSFLEFSSKFWKYSFVNQMLIWFQSGGRASNVAGYEKWKELGRQVKGGAKALKIFAPMMKKVRDAASGEETQRVVGFRIVNVFEYADTAALDGEALEKWQANNPDKKPFEPVSKDFWMKESNEDTDRTKILRDAAIEFAAEKGIDITTSEDTGSAGGYSSGGEVSIDHSTKGESQLRVLIHEIAHELIHWAIRKNPKHTPDEIESIRSHKAREIDADSVSYIVMKHFGLEPASAPNYLALTGATSADIRDRRDHISRATKAIIEGMTKHMGQPGQPQQQQQSLPAEEGEGMAAHDAVPASSSWILKNCKFAQVMKPD